MSDEKYLVADGDFADRAARIDRERDPNARRERQAKLAAIGEKRVEAVTSVRRYQVAISRHERGWTASTLDHPPLVGPLHAVGRSEQHVLTELRFAYATALVRHKFVASMQEARAYALGAEWVPVDLTFARIQVQV